MSSEMEEREIPTHFLCPISLQLMGDPVTIPTGITYDREHIERWIFASQKATCPVTKQPLVINGDIFTPNHTLRRLIHSWCTPHRIPTPCDHQISIVGSHQICKLLDDVSKSPELQYTCLQRINSVLASDARAKKILEASGAFMKVTSIMMDNNTMRRANEEALCVLAQIDPPKNKVNALLRNEDDPFIDPILGFLRAGSSETREYAIRVLKSVYDVADPIELANAKCELFVEINKLIRYQATNVATKQALKLLIELNPWGKNRVKAVGAGTVSALVELLFDGSTDRRACELGLMGLDQLCGCAEGRAALVGHGAGLAVVSKKILRVSHVATDRAVRILSSVSRYSATGRVVGEMVEVGVVPKLCMLVQVDCRAKTKERVKEILRLHSWIWKNSPCIPPHLLSAYPSWGKEKTRKQFSIN
ncbi:hypothetical protein Cgig2_015921 [Carnegiea gigantea]|uniref:U-box domain-containing protein n=1 Tax=Carnegiea gigantea TaxID=171969 RepID=A0A9Q1KM48_9CARY|nr:hypothetical protein Cgig2_015921 [Carnegiea gigantea]